MFSIINLWFIRIYMVVVRFNKQKIDFSIQILHFTACLISIYKNISKMCSLIYFIGFISSIEKKNPLFETS